jgi:hypothetical protein
MKTVAHLALLGVFAAGGALAADRVDAYQVQLTSPAGTIDGVLVAVGDQLVFVDQERLGNSFAVPRSDLRSVTLQNSGTVVVEASRPFTDRFGSRSNLVIRMTDPDMANSVIQWVGLPVVTSARSQTTITQVERNGTSTVTRAVNGTARAVEFNVVHDHAAGNCSGRLIVAPQSLEYVSISEDGHSKKWTYDQIEEFERNREENKVIVETRNGPDETFKLNGVMDDVVYNAVVDRIVDARRR